VTNSSIDVRPRWAVAATAQCGRTGRLAADLDAAFTALTQHASPAWTVVRGGTVLASRGEAPRAFPKWIEGDRFSGLVRDGDRKLLRAVARKGNAFAIVETPYDPSLFAALENESGIVVNLSSQAQGQKGGIGTASRQTSGTTLRHTHDQFTGKPEPARRADSFSVNPPRLYASLTTGTERIRRFSSPGGSGGAFAFVISWP
jgi:hypothetical protein